MSGAPFTPGPVCESGLTPTSPARFRLNTACDLSANSASTSTSDRPPFTRTEPRPWPGEPLPDLNATGGIAQHGGGLPRRHAGERGEEGHVRCRGDRIADRLELRARDRLRVAPDDRERLRILEKPAPLARRRARPLREEGHIAALIH